MKNLTSHKTLVVMLTVIVACAVIVAFADDSLSGDNGKHQAKLAYGSQSMSWESLQALLNDGGKVTLANNVTATDADDMLSVSTAVTLDLAGHTLNAGGLFCAIEVCEGGSLMLTNSVVGSGAITGGSSDEGGGVCVYEGGVFTMTGGAITGNVAEWSGGGVYVEGGVFTMTGGTISGNTTGMDGGGVYVYEGMFTMTGGEISGNTTEGDGGGVFVEEDGTLTMTGGGIFVNAAYEGGGVYVNDGTFAMSGGTISGNATDMDGGGVYVFDSTLTVSGAPDVSGNTNSAGVANNVWLGDSSMIEVSGLSSGAYLGVTAEDGPTVDNPIEFATGAVTGDEVHFFSDNPNYHVERDSDTLWLVAAGYPTYLEGADDAVKDRYDDWAELHGADTDGLYWKHFLLNIAPSATPSELRVVGIEVVEGGMRVRVAATEVDLSDVNGVISVAAGTAPNELVPKAVAVGNITYSAGTATIFIPSSAGTFVKVVIGFVTPME